MWSPRNQLQGNSLRFEINTKQFEKAIIHFKNDDFAAVYVVILKFTLDANMNVVPRVFP